MNQPPHDPHSARENLSALVDGALEHSATSFLLRRLEHDAELRACYGRYQLIGDCLRRGQAGLAPAPDGFAERVRQALADEAAPRRVLPWRAGAQLAAGLFTAAVVAAGAFWYVQPEDRVAGDQFAAGSEVRSSGVRADDLRRQLPLLPVSARSSRPLGAEFAPQPDPEAWQQATMAPLHYPSTQYIILVPRSSLAAPAPAEPGKQP